MANFDINLDSIIESTLSVKASGSLNSAIEHDLSLPDGENIEILLANEEKLKKSKA